MRAMSWMTAIASAILSIPMVLWALGLSVTLMTMVHLFAFFLVTRLLFLTASIAQRTTDVMWVGGFAGAIGALTSQLLIHAPSMGASLAVAFGAYGTVGAALYRVDLFSWWWPFTLTLWSAVFYAGLGAAMYRLLSWRRRYLPWAKG